MPTERSEYRCVVKEGPSGPFLAFEPMGGEEPRALRGKVLAIDLRRGITLERAEALARELDRNMVGLAIT
jgi:hypothetical protein